MPFSDKILRWADCCATCSFYDEYAYECFGTCKKFDFVVERSNVCDCFQRKPEET